MPRLLVEIGTEELPSPMLDVVYGELEAKAKALFESNRLACSKICVEATPRRIALFAEFLTAKQKDQVLEFSGPSYEKAYEPSGQPTRALEGFLRSKGASIKEVQIKETPKGRFVVLSQHQKGQALKKVLPELLNGLFQQIGFPKNMRWESSGFRFPRPVRWVMTLLDKEVLRFSFAGLKSGNTSYGHRFLGSKAFKMVSADWTEYSRKLERQHVILDLEKRKDLIRKALRTKFAQPHLDEGLVHTTAQLIEEPFLMEGGFSKDYLELPSDVLSTCMRKHQKIFACYDAKGKLKNQFVAVLNGERKGLARIRADFENVLESRLKDARFFYDADTREPLSEKQPLLSQIVYLGKLGSMLDKTRRLETLAGNLCRLCGKPEMTQDLQRTASLAKIDLMTQMVFEFTELQGIVGGEYARVFNEKEEVAQAIAAQYLPKNLAENYKDTLKAISPLGALFGILDRFDLLIGALGTGMEPSGSQDPFALRRAAGVIVKLIRAHQFHFSLDELTSANAQLYGDKLTVPVNELNERLKNFLKERVAFELEIAAGSRDHEILQAVFKTSFTDIADVFVRFETLRRLYDADRDLLIKTAKVIERTSNISKNAGPQGSELEENLLQEPSEKLLFKALTDTSDALLKAFECKDYERATQVFGRTFYQPVNDFFEQVMVNVEDTSIRNNRQALMKRICSLYTDHLADLSVLSRMEQ
ncbi:MAG: glycine--tRNA ligase subunit beta [Candidatus Omnitrophica bacterium]|nr:glycine--tRNA ligase subunit beta [Candidatus Omnitrophota bacterium]